MGKASRWFRSLLGSKKSPESSALAAVEKKKSKSATSSSANASIRFKNGAGGENHLASPYEDGGLDANKHAIAVAAATAAVADAAIAAAQAAVEVVKLTSGSWRSATPYRGGDRRQPVVAAVKIQSAFRAYLARRALRALKALVKLQARVRGYIVRKQSADLLRRMQAMARIQARASAHRSYTTPESSNIDTNSHHSGITNPRKYEEMSNSAKHTGSLLKMQHSHLRPHTTWLNHWMEQSTLNINNNSLDAGPINDEKSDKILEIDTWKPHQTPRQNNRPKNNSSRYFSAWNETGHDYSKTRLSSKHHNPNPSISSEEVQSLISPKFQVPPRTAVISPGGRSSSSRPTSNLKGPFTPTRSECSRSVNGEYLSHPNYMASTTSSWAKVRSQSAPKQRMQFDELGLSTKIGRGFWESDAISEKGSAYRYMGQLKRQVNPTHNANAGFSSTYRYRL